MSSIKETAKQLVERTKRLKEAGLIPKHTPVTYKIVPTTPLSCIHRGEPTGEEMPCTSCGGKKSSVPVLFCNIHQKCTTDRIFAGIICCKECDDRQLPNI